MINFSKNIRAARGLAGLKQPELARRIGLTKSTVSQWESGTIKKVDGENLVKAAAVLKVSPWWLLYGKDSAEAEVQRRKGLAPSKIGAPENGDIETLISLFLDATPEAQELAVHALAMGQDASGAQYGLKASFGDRTKSLIEAVKKGRLPSDRPRSQ